MAQFVAEHDTALHAGRVAEPTAKAFASGDPNRYTVGIEFEDGGDPEGVSRPDAQYRAGARLIGRIARRWRIGLDRDHVIGHREIFARKSCPGNLDLDRLLGEARALPSLTCLLPVRNGEAHIDGYLASIAGLADSVIALDDGSEDRTRELLEAAPLVARVLANPPRPDYRGWDDAENRRRLVEAAGASGWLFFLDADERLDADDAIALREFIDGDSMPGCAYGFRVFAMAGDEQHFSKAGLWVYRLFAGRPQQTMPGDRLHFVPVPIEIPPERRLRTTVRIKHLAGITRASRLARRAKYAEADPDESFQSGYDALLQAPERVREWQPRDPDLPILDANPQADAVDLTAPVLSAVVISRDDEDRIERCVKSVAGQICERPFEVIVVSSGTDRTAEIVRERFPSVRLVELNEPALPGAARNAGVRIARGDYISFPGSHVELPPGSLAARIEAHEAGHSMVTGTILNGTLTCSGWASYFLDHSGVLPGRPSEPLGGPPAHCSYTRDALIAAGPFPEDMRAGEDTVVNTRLAELGFLGYRAGEVRLFHASPCRRPWTLVAHHFRRGRSLGRILADRHFEGPRLLGARSIRRHLVGYLPSRLRRTGAQVARWGGSLRPVYRRVWPLVALGSAAAWTGMWAEILRPMRGRTRVWFRGSATDLAVEVGDEPQGPSR